MTTTRLRFRALTAAAVLMLSVVGFSLDYTVERGDTLGGIARDQGVSLIDLVTANEVSNPDLIYPGQVLVIPGDGNNETLYVVERGDTLVRIANRFATSVGSVVSANTLANPDLILVGQELLIPQGTSPSPDRTAETGTGRSGGYHIVERGESVADVAAHHNGVSTSDVIRANGIVNGLIYAGTRLFLDGPGHIATGSSGETTYRVQRGDRLIDIARSHDAGLRDIISVNDIADPNLIQSGTTLRIPGGTRWVCPVQDASFINGWGFPRDGGERYHEGQDLFAPHGTPVRAPESGTVQFVTGTIGGRGFRLDTPTGIRYFGTHLERFGQDGAVNAGDVVGYVGNTGNAERPQLHFGMAINGTVINAYPTLIENQC